MNLLRDKRDDERPVEWTPEYAAESEPQESGRDNADHTKSAKSKTQNTLGTLLIAAAIFIAAILITYFGFYKPKEGVVPVDTTPKAQMDSSDRSGDDVGLESTEPATQPIQSTVASDAAGEFSLNAAARFMQTIQEALGSGRVTAFFLDEGSFSAEIDAGSVDDAREVYNSIQASLAQMELTSSIPNGPHALVSGTFAAKTVTQPSGIADSDIEQNLRQMSSESGTTVSALSVDASPGEQTFIVMRINGSFNGCQRFVEKLSQKAWNVSVSKLILMPSPTGDYTFVLRFYM